MILLDTDTLSIAQRPHDPDAAVLRSRIALVPSDEMVGTTIISYEEQTRGWFTYVAKARTSAQRMDAYSKLLKHLDNWRRMSVTGFDGAASGIFDGLRSNKIRIGTADLKIAAIALAHNALLLSRNLQDFEQVPGLWVEDWTRPA